MINYLKEVSHTWNIGRIEFLKNYSTMGERRVDLIKTDIGMFVVKTFPTSVEEDKIKKYTESLKYLNIEQPNIAPLILKTANRKLYSRIIGRFTYLMQKVDGRQLETTVNDEYKLGQASANLHLLTEYKTSSCLNISKIIQNMKSRFKNYSFKHKYDSVINSIPNYNNYKQTFIHTDIGPHNALLNHNNEVVFIDLDDAGRGSPYIDIGYPLITQFVQMNKKSKEIHFNQDIARSFYKGYNSIIPINKDEKELIYYGAIFMQLMYMPCFGEKAVEDMWAILKFGLDNKDLLMDSFKF